MQMESFPAAEVDQFAFIKSLIDQCDYYVLIIAGRYGSVAEDGLSYTHKEFRYAVLKRVPILLMLHEDLGAISADKSEDTDEGRKRLKQFIDEAQTGRLRRTWGTIDELKLRVREALDYAKATKPRTGWVRGDSVARIETLEELNAVRRENDQFRKALGKLEIYVPLPEIPAADEEIEIDILPGEVSGFSQIKRGSTFKLKGTWVSFFPIFFENLKWQSNDWNGSWYHTIDQDGSCVAIGSALAGEVAAIDASQLFKISKGTFERLSSYYQEIGLMTEDEESLFTETAKRLSRRHRISCGAASQFAVIDGEVKVTVEAYDIDDIPF
ncbi:hypothetical protein EL18_00576 [Nitratireductor basaltis]|uniref:DUF4062 domain-containing protein n=1 Tax=Nitratireductor basaltis TaxID=472175 RepID=A0A084U9C4_9HYPH|nr:hypothetical protein EL18_00576 [Nitratireductor basaltis]